MRKIIGVRFRTAGKVYFFDPKELFIKKGDHVIVETARGLEYGTVVSGIQELEDDKINQPLKPVCVLHRLMMRDSRQTIWKRRRLLSRSVWKKSRSMD